MTVRVTLEPSESPGALLYCFLCGHNFQVGSMVARLSCAGWWINVCPDCLPSGKDDTALREAALGYRESLLWTARVMERIGLGPAIESVTREQLQQANALDEITPKGESERDERPTIN